MSNNAQDFTHSGLLITVVETKLSLALPAAGPTRGGTCVGVFGTGLVPAARTVECNFGDERSPATLEGARTLFCVSPQQSEPITVALHLSLDNVSQRSGLRFVYTAPVRTNAIWPSAGPSRGGTLVTINGDFSQQALPHCRFAGSNSGSVGPPVLGRWLSPQRIECVAPRHSCSGADQANFVALEMSINGQQFTTSGLGFVYLPEVELLDLQPSQGPIRGGTMITLRGKHLHTSYAILNTQLMCRINESSSLIISNAHSTDVLECIAPASEQLGSVAVRIASNGQDISSELHFEYLEIHCFSASPALGPVSGGTKILVTCFSLPVASVICRFGAHARVPATTYSNNVLLCDAPPKVDAGRISLSLMCSGTVCGNPVSFEYFEDVSVTGITPTSGASGNSRSYAHTHRRAQ